MRGIVLSLFSLAGLLAILPGSSALVRAEDWKFRLIWESQVLSKDPIVLLTTADVDRNGTKEIVATDFGFEVAGRRDSKDSREHLFVFEWSKQGLKTRFRREWDPTEGKGDELVVAKNLWRSTRLMSWNVGGRTVVETIPPYLGLEWKDGQYLLREQGRLGGGTVGSWALPWESPWCYGDPVPQEGPQIECFVGLRDFSGDGKTSILTFVQEQAGVGTPMSKLRVRALAPGFPIEWESKKPQRWVKYGVWQLGVPEPIDWLNGRARNGLLLLDHESRRLYHFDLGMKGYQPTPTQLFKKGVYGKEVMGITSNPYPDGHYGQTRQRGIGEYWGYHFIDGPDKGPLALLRKVVLKPDLKGFLQEDVEFPQHEQFIGVGYFDVADLDEDGLDEVILVEQTGKREFTEEHVVYSDTADYIRVLKWDGKRYQTMWVSSEPYASHGIKFIVDDVTGAGKKQLVVTTGEGAIQIWEKN